MFAVNLLDACYLIKPLNEMFSVVLDDTILLLFVLERTASERAHKISRNHCNVRNQVTRTIFKIFIRARSSNG